MSQLSSNEIRFTCNHVNIDTSLNALFMMMMIAPNSLVRQKEGTQRRKA